MGAAGLERAELARLVLAELDFVPGAEGLKGPFVRCPLGGGSWLGVLVRPAEGPRPPRCCCCHRERRTAVGTPHPELGARVGGRWWHWGGGGCWGLGVLVLGHRGAAAGCG